MSRKYLIPLFIFLVLLVAFFSVFILQKKGKINFDLNSSIIINNRKFSSKNVEYLVTQNLSTYSSADEETYRSYLIPGKVFKVIGKKDDWLKISVYEKAFNLSWEGWIKESKTNYKPTTD